MLLFLLHIFACGFILRREKKGEGVVTSLVCCFVKYRLVYSLASYLLKRTLIGKKKFEEKKYRKKKERREREKEKTKTKKQDFLLLKYKIIIWTVHFFFFFSFFIIVVGIHSYSTLYSCLPFLQRYFAPITWTLTMTTEAKNVQAHVRIE